MSEIIKVYVDYRMPHDKDTLEKEFSIDGVADRYFEQNIWYKHDSCKNYDEIPKYLDFALKHFGRNIFAEDAIKEMDSQGFRPATHLEGYAFVKYFPWLQYQFKMIAVGSYMYYGDDDYDYCIAFRSKDSKSILSYVWFYGESTSETRFLFVKK